MNQLQRDLLRRRITEKFTRNPARPGDRSAAVLLPIVDRIEPAVVGIWRAQHGIHGGQFCFPGGSVEAGDENAWETAIRETREEIGLEDPVESLSGLGEYNTHVSSFRVDVHVGFVDGNPRWRRQPSEVEAILEIPLSFLQGLHARLPKVEDVWDLPIDAGYDLDPSPFLIDGELPERGAGHRLEAAEGPRDMPFIWGLSARVLYDFLNRAWEPALEDMKSSRRIRRP
ncbi:MAG: CoA pyrophosphatase [Planctomycetota bacterium]